MRIKEAIMKKVIGIFAGVVLAAGMAPTAQAAYGA
jgi:hypothetical protein